MTPVFLTDEAVLEIHREQIAQFGGAEGVRDAGLLASALGQPEATFDGEFLHADLHTMAAAHMFHLIRNHPFVDGNKRTGLAAALVFLDLNGVSIKQEEPALYDLAIGVAEGRLDKATLAERLRQWFPLPEPGT